MESRLKTTSKVCPVIFGTQLEKVHHLDPVVTQGHLFIRQKALYLIDKGDVVEHKKNPVDIRVVLPQQGRAMNQDQCFPAARGLGP